MMHIVLVILQSYINRQNEILLLQTVAHLYCMVHSVSVTVIFQPYLFMHCMLMNLLEHLMQNWSIKFTDILFHNILYKEEIEAIYL